MFIDENKIYDFISIFLNSSSNNNIFEHFLFHAPQILDSKQTEVVDPLVLESNIITSDIISIESSVKLRHLLNKLKKQNSIKNYTNILTFLTLTSGNTLIARLRQRASNTRTILGQININNMNGRIASNHNDAGGAFSSDSASTRDLLSGTTTPASLWGTPTPNPPTSIQLNSIDRSVGSRRAYRVAPNATRNIGQGAPMAEQELLREVILSLSGASGSLVQYNPTLDAFVVPSNLILPSGAQSNILRISECGWLHNRIRRFVDEIRQDQTSGKVLLALAMAIDEQLTEYYRLVATLEAQLNRDQGLGGNFEDPLFKNPTFNSTEAPTNNTNSNHYVNQSDDEAHQLRQPLSLARLVLWLREPKRRLKLLAGLCDACDGGKKGGAIASSVFAFSRNGREQHMEVLENILVHVTRAIYEMIALWIYDGKLSDPNKEFFIAVSPSVSNQRMWYEKYGIRKSMLPTFISMDQAKKILLIGKSVNFLMHVCGESQHLKDQEAIRNSRLQDIDSIFEQEFNHSFPLMISTAYTHISKQLLDILLSQYHFMEHLKASRQFLLLGQGDFIQRLMDLLEPELALPAPGLLKHQLSEILETAIRDTNAQYLEPEILQRLDVQLLDLTTGDSGWDVFSLEYIVDGPLTTIFTADCRLSYLKAFNFLWRLKRMEFTMSRLWREQLVLAGYGHDLASDLTPVLHVIQLLGAEIRHFVQQLQYYVNFEALECAWGALVKRIVNANDLDDVILAHTDFLSAVISRCLLDAHSGQLICQLRAIFDLIINFSQLNEDLIEYARDEYDARCHHQQQINNTAHTGKWGICKLPEKQELLRRKHFVDSTIGPLVARLRVLASSYRDMVTEFLSMLQFHCDPSLRLLAQNLNFNLHYAANQIV